MFHQAVVLRVLVQGIERLAPAALLCSLWKKGKAGMWAYFCGKLGILGPSWLGHGRARYFQNVVSVGLQVSIKFFEHPLLRDPPDAEKA